MKEARFWFWKLSAEEEPEAWWIGAWGLAAHTGHAGGSQALPVWCTAGLRSREDLEIWPHLSLSPESSILSVSLASLTALLGDQIDGKVRCCVKLGALCPWGQKAPNSCTSPLSVSIASG